MATRCANSNAGASQAGTWGLCVSGAENDSQAATVAVTNATQSSATFTGLSDVVDAILLAPSSRPGSSGTLTVKLRNVTDATDAATVTINITDIPANTIQGLLCLQFASAPVTLNPAKTYRLDYITSANGLLVLYASTASAANIARFLRSTATGAPAAGDKLLVCAEHTGAGASTTRTVTVDADLGIGGFAISDGGTVTCPRTASINRTITLSGYTVDGVKRGIWCYSGGTFDGGSVASPIPASSTLTVVLNVASNVEFGIEAPGGTFGMAGDPAFRTAYRGLATVDGTAGGTTFTLDSSCGWKNNDEIASGSTTRTNTQCQRRTLNADMIGASGTVGAAWTNAYSGTNSGGYDTRCPFVLLTRNVKILGASASIQSFINIPASTGAILNLDFVEVKWMGQNGAKFGITQAAGTLSITNCGIYEFGMNSSGVAQQSNCSGYTATTNSITSCVFSNNNLAFNTGSQITSSVVLTGIPVTWSGNWGILSNGGGISGSASGPTITNNRMCGCLGVGFSITSSNPLGTFSGNIAHSNASNGFGLTNLTGGSASNCTAWRNNAHAISLASMRGTFTFDTFKEFDGSTASILANSITGVFNFTNGNFGPLTGSGFSTTDLVVFNGPATLLVFENCALQPSAAYTQLVHPAGQHAIQVLFRYCSIGGSPTDVLNPQNLDYGSYVGFSYYNQTNTHKRYTRNGLREFLAGGGVKFTPSQAFVANTDLIGTGPMETQVTSGQQVSLTVHVLKSASYNGPQPTLWLLANGALGVNADTLLATAVSANGVDEGIAVNYVPTADGEIEVEVRCAGTVGNVQVTRFTASGGYQTLGDQERYLRGNPESVLT